MAKFLKDNELNSEIEKIFDRANEQLILISPYIKLHDRFISTLQTKKNDPKLEIIVVFGKNEDDLTRSMRKEDFDFFKDFPNIEIRYEKRLHAKYYANDSSAILTSMNLYSYSQDHNIEAGILTKSTLFGSLKNNIISNVAGTESLDQEAYNYFSRVIEQAELLYSRKPEFETSMLGLTKKYLNSKVDVDRFTEFFSEKPKPDSNFKREIKIVYPPKVPTNTNTNGYCIRFGTPIPLNPKRPFCNEAYESWSKFKNEEYPEKYCHFTGEASNGETSFAKPIMRKNWSKAKEIFKA
jgi:hypothetical protein